jgi:sulfur carrier protein
MRRLIAPGRWTEPRPSAWRRWAAISDDQPSTRAGRRAPTSPMDPSPADSCSTNSRSGHSGQDDCPTAAAAPGSEVGTIGLTVNGETRRCPAGLMLPEVLVALGYRPQLVVVEFNGAILPRPRWPEQPVGESDVLEVVTIVGGGS